MSLQRMRQGTRERQIKRDINDNRQRRNNTTILRIHGPTLLETFVMISLFRELLATALDR